MKLWSLFLLGSIMCEAQITRAPYQGVFATSNSGAPPSGYTYYVSQASGLDTNPGTATFPWATTARADIVPWSTGVSIGVQVGASWKPYGPRGIILAGDSITARQDDASNFQSEAGYYTFGNLMSFQRFNQLHNAGVTGDRTDNLQARLSLDVLAYPAQYVSLLIGVNDLLQGIPASTIITNWTAIANAITASGRTLIISSVPPASAYTTTAKTDYGTVDTAIKSYASAHPAVIFADMGSAYRTSLANPIPLASYTTDGTHPNAAGAELMGQIWAAAVNAAGSAVPLPYTFGLAGTNLLTNGAMSGTGGFPATSATGWSGQSSLATYTKVARTDGVPGDWQQIAFTSATSKNTFSQSVTVPASTSLEFAWEVQSDNNWGTVSWEPRIQAIVNSVFYPSHSSGGTSLDLNFNPLSGIHRGKPFPVPVGITTATARWEGQMTAGTNRLGRAEMFAVQAPAMPQTTGLTATAGDTTNALSWTPVTGATNYAVRRSTVTGGPYTPIATPTTASYTDTGLTDGTTYYYVISAWDILGDGLPSAEASATPISTRNYLVDDSENIALWGGSTSHLTFASATVPTGGTYGYATKLQEDNVNNYHYKQSVAISSLPAGSYTVSAMVKAAERTVVSLAVHPNSNFPAADFTLTGAGSFVNGTGGSACAGPYITDRSATLGAGWYEIGCTVTVTSLINYVQFFTQQQTQYQGVTGSGMIVTGVAVNAGTVRQTYHKTP